MNPLQKLWSERQSFWLDFISRDLFKNGELKTWVNEKGLRGMTSNPTIFEKAISSSNLYDADLKKFAQKGKTNYEIFEELAIHDIQKAADTLKPVYTSSKGLDGFVSLEVNPNLAYQTEATFEEAKKLTKKVKRPNLMIKIPGTKEGIPAIEESVAAGLNINITLLFSVENYKAVLEAYLKGLERRVKKGLPIKKIVSVASFFVSRVDTAVDKLLDQKISENSSDSGAAKNLLHKAAIANAKLAYAHFKEISQTERYQLLKAKGANDQRLLWGSTGTKDKRLSDVVYIDELIGPGTVNTMPPHTAEAFLDHGKVANTLEQDVDRAQSDINALSTLNIDFDGILAKLQQDGVTSFINSFNELMNVIGSKREILIGQHDKKMTIAVSDYKRAYDELLKKVDQEKWIQKIWNKEASLWKQTDDHKKIIQNSLGWLRVPGLVLDHLPLLRDVGKDVKKGKFTHILLLGMGGSSLAPEVLRLTFGKKSGFPDFSILDSTEPASVIDRSNWSKPAKTLYIVASKSGSTAEPNAFLAAFYDQVKKVKGNKAGENFIAITDPGTQMEQIGKEKKFRHIILNPSDIGGRYSALSFFGMLPAALMGIDVEQLLKQSLHMSDACGPAMPTLMNPGARLGVALGLLANQGRDKVTFFLSKDIESFSTWAEQLIAESTGKEGKGIVPVEWEELQDPKSYGDDRIFVSISTKKSKNQKLAATLKTLERLGHPVIQITMDSKYDLAAEFFRWEIATAVAGAVIGINPFDQPNVQEAKDLTKEYINKYKEEGKLSGPAPNLVQQHIAVTSTNGISQYTSLEDTLQAFIKNIQPGDYLALLAYVKRDDRNKKHLQAIRNIILKSKKVATTVGFGPRFLHSTGQLHKGGANNGVFIQITADDPEDMPIPGEPFGFSVLKEAQALGDYNALINKDRRILRIHLSESRDGLQTLKEIFSSLNLN